jgi:hypothetical protein
LPLRFKSANRSAFFRRRARFLTLSLPLLCPTISNLRSWFAASQALYFAIRNSHPTIPIVSPAMSSGGNGLISYTEFKEFRFFRQKK